MRLYAVTYTDPSEPWGEAIWERKLYQTPSEVLDAFNRCYDEFADRFGDDIAQQMRDLPANYRRFDDDSGWSRAATLEEAVEEEFSREFSVGFYESVT